MKQWTGLALAMLWGWAGPAAAGGVVVTGVTVEGSSASVVLNGKLEIRGIGFSRVGEKTVLQYPEWVNPKTGRRYPQVKVLDRAVDAAIARAIETGKVAAESPALTWRISSLTKMNRPGGRRKANVEVTFNDALVVVLGVGMKEGRADLGVQWPARWAGPPPRPGEKPDPRSPRVQLVTLKDKDLAAAIEKKVMERYEASISAAADE